MCLMIMYQHLDGVKRTGLRDEALTRSRTNDYGIDAWCLTMSRFCLSWKGTGWLRAVFPANSLGSLYRSRFEEWIVSQINQLSKDQVSSKSVPNITIRRTFVIEQVRYQLQRVVLIARGTSFALGVMSRIYLHLTFSWSTLFLVLAHASRQGPRKFTIASQN